jgi:hypothetical protein
MRCLDVALETVDRQATYFLNELSVTLALVCVRLPDGTVFGDTHEQPTR